MKILISILLLLLPAGFSYAQFDDLLDKVKPDVDILEEKNITSSIEDAYPVAFWLDNLTEIYPEPVEPDNYTFNLEPGYYRFTIQSYCLKAGTHGPQRGPGYLIAPIKGKRDDIVYNIISRSVNYPEIVQRDIQLLLWAIIAGAKFTDLDQGLQLRVRPLLTDTEIADLSIGIKDVPSDMLPTEAKNVLQFYKDFRAKLTNPASTYEEIETMAVLPGDPPSDLFVKNVPAGNWAYAGNGFYMRVFPEAYYKTVLEVYRPRKINVQRDNLNRISLYEYEGKKIEISYQDETGSDVMYVDGKGYYPIWRFKSIKFIGLNPGEEYTIENKGWIIRGDGKEVKNPSGTFKNYTQDPTLAEYQKRLNAANDFFKKIKKYKNDAGKNPIKGGEQFNLTDDFNAEKHMMDGLKAASDPSDLKGKGDWIKEHLDFVQDWWNNASGALAGNTDNEDNSSRHFNPAKKLGAPGNKGAQRIAVSQRKY